jgi:stress response protein YsnF
MDPTPDAIEVIRSEEEVLIEKEHRPYEHVRVRKEVVTEEVTVTVPLRYEVLHVERVRLDIDEQETAGADVPKDLSGGSETHVLYAETPVIGKRIVPRERVTLTREVVVDDVEVSTPRRIEHVEVEREDR